MSIWYSSCNVSYSIKPYETTNLMKYEIVYSIKWSTLLEVLIALFITGIGSAVLSRIDD